MTDYPSGFDSDSTIFRVDDNITEIAGAVINQLRTAVFSIERELGINPAGSAGSVANRLDKSLDPNGDLKSSALTSIGLATLPIVDNQVASSAAIKESKLALDFNTSDLHTLIVGNDATLNSLSSFTTTINADLLIHISGGTLLNDNSPARHVASHIDINSTPSDSRDPSFLWSGLLDKDGNQRSATHVASALEQINDSLTSHENTTSDAHPATAVTVDTANFQEISSSADTVQKVLDDIDNSETLKIGLHRATMHSNGVPHAARSNIKGLDGYSKNIVEPTTAKTFLVKPPATNPVDNNSSGDDLIQFLPDNNTGFVFDEQFTKVRVGDIVTVNYGNGVETKFPIESIRFIPNTEWFIRINGVNLFNTPDGYDGYAFARIDRPLFDNKTQGVLAVGAANPDSAIAPNLIPSLIVGNARGASAVGIGFDPNKLDSSHFNLYLQLYPTGNPNDKVIGMPAIDVTGNSGATPGQYTIDSIVQSTNDALRKGGFNYRFIAFNHNGEFGIMLADEINNASFSIISGDVSGTSLTTGSFINNVIGDASDGQDPLGLGASKVALASPSFVSTFPTTEAATDFPTKIIVPLKNRNFIADGVRRDNFAETYLANSDGYWPATITARTPVGSTTVETTYTVDMSLKAADLKPGKTIVVQPDVDFDDVNYNDVDYGRFTIKEVSFTEACSSPVLPATTVITVINSRHASGTPTGFTNSPQLPVRLFFSEDSVSFNSLNVIDAVPTGTTYNRFHEVYVSGEGKTFTHERVRMPKQAEDAGGDPLLGTLARWTIKDVSPKLRGFRDDSSSNLNKYVRFYVLNYNSSTGEFDGYIGRRIAGTDNIVDTGEVVRGRKNVPVKFYDDSNSDFIEIKFEEDAVSPGTSILSSALPRYVDIEIFPSLQLDEEMFLLATCELDDTRVQCVQDRRQFGNVSEKNFSDSAIDFITAGDRFLHENGVLRGLTIDGIDPSDSSLINMNGGVALVNGHIVVVNGANVRIPEIRETGASLPATVTWGICVNENGQFLPIIITSSKQQFFATTGSGNYYIPSVSFNELINARKDLTIVATVTATINSIALNASDARRFSDNVGLNTPLSWTGDNSESYGSFQTFSALTEWINNSQRQNNYVKVRGTFEITEQIDFSALNFPTVFDGEDGATFDIQSVDRALLLGSDLTFKNITIDYTPLTIAAGTSNVNHDNGGFYANVSSGNTLQNLTIENCKFIVSAFDAERPPTISIELNLNSLADNINILNCRWSEDSTHAKATAIAIVNTNSGVGSAAPVLANSRIEGNITDQDQAILITTAIVSENDENIEAPGLYVVNTNIRRNSCGTIGFITGSTPNTTLDYLGSDNANSIVKPGGLNVSDNTCHLIASIDGYGRNIVEDFSLLRHGTGYVNVSHNRANWIHLMFTELPNESTNLVIDSNILTAFDSTYLASFTETFVSNGVNAAIRVRSTSTIIGLTVSFNASAVISNNNINAGRDNVTTYTYDDGLDVRSSATINSNNIHGFVDDGISCGTSSGVQISIIGNKITRGSTTIDKYLVLTGGLFYVVDNFFDSPTFDGADTNIITSFPAAGSIIERNKNQTSTLDLFTTNSSVLSGQISIRDVDAGTNLTSILSGPTGLNSVAGIAVTGTVVLFHYIGSDAGKEIEFRWDIPLDAILPANVQILEVTFTATVGLLATFDTKGDMNVLLSSSADTQTSSTLDLTSVSNGSVTMTVTTPTNFITRVNSPALKLTLFADESTGSSRVITIDDLTVTYRW